MLILLGYMIYCEHKDRKAQRRADAAYRAKMSAAIRKVVNDAYPPAPLPKPMRSWSLP
jgi:hypothetical protein